VPPAEIQPVRFVVFVRVAELADERRHVRVLVITAVRLGRHHGDGLGGFDALEILDGKLLDLPAEKIRFGIAVLGDAQLRFQREPVALRGGARLQLTVRIKLLGINPAEVVNAV
jgi:hypothetical protein